MDALDQLEIQHYDEMFDVHTRLRDLGGLRIATGLEGWKESRARKHHMDLFGEEIQPGDHYFWLKTGPSWDAVVKLSQLNMRRVVYVMSLHPGVDLLASAVRNQQDAKLYSVLSQLWRS